MKLTLLYRKSLIYLIFSFLSCLSVFAQSPPHIIASANITTVTFCKSDVVNLSVSYRFYNAGGTTATAPFRHNSGSGPLGMEMGDYSAGSLVEIEPGQTLTYNRVFSYDPDNYAQQGMPLPDTDYTETFFMTCAEPGATYETASIHLLSLASLPAQLTTQEATNVTATSATLNGNVITYGQCPDRGPKSFVVATDPGFESIVANTFALPGSATGPFSYNIQNLLPGTTYYYVAKAVSFTGNSAPFASSFTTPAAASNDLCNDAAPLSVSAPAVQGSLTNATGGDVFYSFTPTVTGSYYITINNFGTPGNKDLTILNGCNGTVLGSGTSASVSAETASASLVAGTTYFIRVTDTDLHRDTFDIRIDPPYPVLSTNGTSSLQFADYFNDTFSASKSFTLSGIDLDGVPGVITVSTTNPAFEVSLDNTSWSGALNVNYTGINLGNTLIYVRMPAQSLGTKSGTITFSGGGVLNAPVITLGGTAVLRPPTVYTNGTTALSFGTVSYAQASGSQSFSLSGIRLTGFPSAVTVSASGTDFQVSTDNADWSATASIPYVTETLTATNVYVRLNPQSLGAKSGTITFAAPGLSGAPTVNVAGTAALSVPDGLSAVPANRTFTANWNAVPGATAYILDVDGSSGFTSPTTSVDLATWSLVGTLNLTSGIAYNGNTAGPLTITGANSTTLNTFGASALNWVGGVGTKYWQVSFSTEGYTQVNVSSFQRGTNNAPRDFRLQYRIGTGLWFDVPGGNIIAANNTTTGLLNSLPLPVQCSNKHAVSLRWIMASETSVIGGVMDNTSRSYIKGISVKGVSMNAVPAFKNYTVSGTSQLVTGLIPGKTYYYRVRAQSNGFMSGYSATGNITTGSTAVWNGSQWTPEIPDDNIDATVTGAYATENNGAFSVHNLTIDTGGSVVVSNGMNISVSGSLNNTQSATAFVVENNGNLLQYGTSNDNTGAVTVKRNTSMNRLDYTYWSSPVSNQNLFAFSPLTLTNRFYEYAENTDLFAVAQTPAFVPAKGYCIRAPNTFAASPAAPQTFEGAFIGVPYNGNVNIPMTKVGQGFNLIGNPYPSTISTSGFFAANPSISALYFWTHKVQGTTGDNAANYTSVNRTGATVAPGTPTPNGTIQVGQGFMAKTSSATTAVFTNDMRVANNLGQFYRSSQTNEVSGTGRIWLNIADTSRTIGQILTGYVENATNDFDPGFDGEAIESTTTQLYNLVNNEAYIIQGRSLPFDVTDSVALGFKTQTAGNYTISIDHTDGLFATGQDIFLEDDLTGTLTDLKAGPYSFASETGTFNSRFKLVYQNVLGIETPGDLGAGIIVYKVNHEVVINSGTSAMQQVAVYDIRGRLLFENDKVNDSIAKVGDLGVANEVVIVKVTTANATITKKVVL